MAYRWQVKTDEELHEGPIQIRGISPLALPGGFGDEWSVIQRRQIRKFADAVERKFRPHKVILFGSYAHGQPTEDPDLAVLVVMNRTGYRGERMSRRISRKAI